MPHYSRVPYESAMSISGVHHVLPVCTQDILQPVPRIPSMKTDVPSLKAIPCFPRLTVAQRATYALSGGHGLVNDFIQRGARRLARDASAGVDVGSHFTILLLLVERQYIAAAWQSGKCFP